MTDRFTIGQLYQRQPPIMPKPEAVRNREAAGGIQTSFEHLLQEKLRLSQHAEIRLKQRGIRLNLEQMAKIESAVQKAEAKGAKESLLLFQDMALIVSVKNRTVVTVMDSASMKDHVFTQIDSAVIVT